MSNLQVKHGVLGLSGRLLLTVVWLAALAILIVDLMTFKTCGSNDFMNLTCRDNPVVRFGDLAIWLGFIVVTAVLIKGSRWLGRKYYKS